MSTDSNSTSGGAVAIPGAAAGRSRSRSLSFSPEITSSSAFPPLRPLPTPIPGGAVGTPSSPSITSSGPASPLSASLRAFSTLALSPPTTLESEEFQKAYHHARSASFSFGARPIVIPDESQSITLPGMSGSPTSAVSDQLPTPSSSPQRASAASGIPTITTKTRASATKGGALGGVCEKEELALGEDDESEVRRDGGAPLSPSLFADGARWGWPQPATSTSLSSSPPRTSVAQTNPSAHGRRASLPTGALNNMAPLGRVVSAGSGVPPAAPSSSNSGFGLFRRLSVGGFGSRPKPPSPPGSFTSGPSPSSLTTSLPNVPPSAPAPPPAVPVSASASSEEPRGRKSLGTTSKPAKRKISPFGERMLQGMHH